WIRGWGPDVEVLEPEELRERFRRWGEELRKMYIFSNTI
ncbi:MAG: WYL domain-containing protein, partial [Fibrobacter sp.]|nr:WYL domain-containing protein [Fibrobacter sp.]